MANSSTGLPFFLGVLGAGQQVAAPDTPSSPTPSDTGTNVAITTSLTWTAAHSTAYDVYFGTVNPPPLVTTVAVGGYSPGTLTAGTTYYWKIAAKNSGGTTTGSVWSFGTAAAVAALPAPWTAADVGAVGLAGTATYNSPTFTLNGAGADITAAADAFLFVSQPLTGDGVITARVASMGNTHLAAKAGLMFRESSAAGARFVSFTSKPAGGTELLARTNTLATAISVATGAAAAPIYLQLVRTGNVFTAYTSADAATWVLIGSTTVAMASAASVGLCVCSHDVTTRNTSTFDTVTVSAAPPAARAPFPATTSTGALQAPTLLWSGPGATSFDVFLDTSAAPTTQVATGITTASYVSSALSGSTLYYWKVKSYNASGSTTSAVFSFTTGAVPPAASSPSPADGATSVSAAATLSWTSAGSTSYDIYFGTAAAPPLVTSGATSATYTPSALASNTTYYWKVKAYNAIGSTTSAVFSFTTAVAGSAPSTPTPVSYASGSVGVPLQPTISWASAGAITYSLLFDTVTPPIVSVGAGQVSTGYTPPSPLLPSTTYYWKVTATNATGSTASGIFTFTTVAGVPVAPTSLTATASSATTIVLAWTKHTTDSTFIIQRSSAAATGLVTTYAAPTNRNVYTKPTLPDVTAGAGTLFTDPAFGSVMLRVTDASTRPGTLNVSYQAPSNARISAWNSDATKFYVRCTDGTYIPYTFDSTGPSAARIAVVGTGDGGLVITSTVVEPQFSYIDPTVVYTAGGANSVTLRKGTFSGSTLTYTDLLDLTTIAGLTTSLTSPQTYIHTITSGGVGSERIALCFGGTSADLDRYALWGLASSLSSNRRVIDTVNSTIATGSGAPVALGTTLGFHLHNIDIDKTGRYVILATTDADIQAGKSALYVWDTQATTVTAISSKGGGHQVCGHGTMINQDGTGTNPFDNLQWQYRALSAVGTTQTLTTQQNPGETYIDDHTSWNNAQASIAVPVLSSIDRYNFQGTAPLNTSLWRAWDDEIIAIATDSPGSPGFGTVWRFCHNRSNVTADDDLAGDGVISPAFYYNPIANISPDGRYAIFTSNWEKTLGTDANPSDVHTTKRQDVFMVQLAGFSTVGTTAINAQTFQDTGLVGSTAYTYKVAAVNSLGTSAYAGPASATTSPPPIPAPTAPSGLTATASSFSSINLAWTDNASNELAFEVWRSGDGGVTYSLITTLGPNVTSYGDSGLTASTQYYYKVRASNQTLAAVTQYSAYTSAANATTPTSAGVSTLHRISWANDATYLGFFNVPQNTSVPLSFESPGMAFDPNGNGGAGSLYMWGLGRATKAQDYPNYRTSAGDYFEQMAEISIPAGISPLHSSYGQAPRASILQDTVEPTEGLWGLVGQDNLGGTSFYGGGIAVVGNNLFFQVCIDYSDNNVKRSVFKRPKNLSTKQQVVGPYMPWAPDVQALYPWNGHGSPSGSLYSSFITTMPSEWQSQFGGDLLLGGVAGNRQFCSGGPCAFAWDSTLPTITNQTLAGQTVGTFPANTMFWYPYSNWLAGLPWINTNLSPNNNTLWSGHSGSRIAAPLSTVIFPHNSRSILYFGTTGFGNGGQAQFPAAYQDISGNTFPAVAASYGNQTDIYYDPALVSGLNGEGCPFPTDPVSDGQGGHNWPYQLTIWHYDVNDMTTNNTYFRANGAASTYASHQPWGTLPYAVQQFTVPAVLTNLRARTATRTRYINGTPGNAASYTTVPSSAFYADGISGVAVDHTTGKVYIKLSYQDGDATGDAPTYGWPIVLVYQLNNLG